MKRFQYNLTGGFLVTFADDKEAAQRAFMDYCPGKPISLENIVELAPGQTHEESYKEHNIDLDALESKDMKGEDLNADLSPDNKD